MKLRVIAEDKNYVAVHKPAGLVTYADSPGQVGAQEILGRQLKKRLFPVHRIDRDTCGLLVFAMSESAARDLTALFRSRVVKKQYLAVVHGMPPSSGAINEPLPRNKEKTKEPALTEFTRLFTSDVSWDGEQRSYSLVRCDMKTGRYHQIRRHMRHIGHPICGDPEYGNGWDNRAFKERFGVERTLLCAVAVAFPDRAQEKMVRLKTSPDPDFQKVMAGFGWRI